ncbi:MAG: helix-turn-helix domain-containing protein [Lachnospiraceae bacterium]|jgi:transcriptional regulator with XRE-family HTH domain|nr:helix-turn-helix domain-containing protein [Lachnospiraceae bacterium]
MTNERLKDVRKSLGLNQTEFGRRLGVTNPAISKLEKGENKLSEQMLLAVCREYGVREEWLRAGDGPMFAESDGTLIAELAAEYGLSAWERKIAETFLSMPENSRAAFSDFLMELAQSAPGAEPPEPAPAITPDDLAEADRAAEDARRRYLDEREREKRRA